MRSCFECCPSLIIQRLPVVIWHHAPVGYQDFKTKIFKYIKALEKELLFSNSFLISRAANLFASITYSKLLPELHCSDVIAHEIWFRYIALSFICIGGNITRWTWERGLIYGFLVLKTRFPEMLWMDNIDTDILLQETSEQSLANADKWYH